VTRFPLQMGYLGTTHTFKQGIIVDLCLLDEISITATFVFHTTYTAVLHNPVLVVHVNAAHIYGSKHRLFAHTASQVIDFNLKEIKNHAQ